MVIDHPEWMAYGACREVPDRWDPVDWVNQWFPEGKGEAATKAYRKIEPICHACPVEQECLDYALTNVIRHGMWGGTRPNERRDLYMTADGRRQPITHGTESGYQTHRRRKVLMCEPCRVAHARYNLENNPSRAGWRERRVLRAVGE